MGSDAAALDGQYTRQARAVNEARRRTLSIFLSLLPAVGLILLLYVGGLVLAVIQSLGYFPAAGLTRLSLDAYRLLFTRPDFLRSLGLTTWVALCSTGVSTLLGLIEALLLRSVLNSAGRRPGWITFLYQLNLPIPHSVGAIAILLLFSQSGLLARLTYAAGWIASPSGFPALVFDRFGIGIILEYLWKTSVFSGIILLAALESASDEHEAAARTLGANTWQRFRYVTLPLLRPALVSASILVFAFTFGGYEVPYLLGQRASSMLPVLAYREYSRVDLTARPQAMAISLFITAVTSAMVWLYMRRMER